MVGSQCISVFKADAKTAFLQGSVGNEELHCEPGVQLQKSVYGLTDAPRAWWERGEKDMDSQGWRTLTKEPCFGVKTSSDGRFYDLAVANVDDFLIALDEECGSTLTASAGVRELYHWRA